MSVLCLLGVSWCLNPINKCVGKDFAVALACNWHFGERWLRNVASSQLGTSLAEARVLLSEGRRCQQTCN